MPTATSPTGLRGSEPDFLELLRIPVVSNRYSQEQELCVAACGAFCLQGGSDRLSPRLRARAEMPALG